MINKILVSSITLTILSISTMAVGENINHTRQLLSTKECEQCDLVGVGLVMSNLSGANLSGANLTNANLSQANLSGANLSGANLTGASLYGANLSGANLSGAIINGTDLRDTYLYHADLTGINFNNAHVQGAQGIPTYVGSPEQFYGWAVAEAQRGNFQGAIAHYNRALTIDSNYAMAYLGRGLAQYRLGNEQQAAQDAEIAAVLFETQNNPQGYQTTQEFIQGMAFAREALENPNYRDPGGDMGQLFQGVFGIVMQFLLP